MKKTETKEPDFAEKMKLLHKRGGITFEQLAEKTGYDVDYLQKVENKELIPTVSSVIQISRALAIESGTFLSAEEKTRRKQKSDVFKKRTSAYAYKTLTPHAEQMHMKGFQVTIEAEADHKGVEYHHEGEEFIYVLSGALDITVGRKRHTLERGASLHFDSSQVHRLRNPGTEPTELIVIVYTP